MDHRKYEVTSRCLPGAGVDRIGEEIRKLAEEEGGRKLEGRTVVLSVGGNDVDRYRGRSEELVDKFRDLLSFLKERRIRVVVQEVLPRPAKTEAWNGLALSLNARLQYLCRNKDGVTFVHFWAAYWGKDFLFRDGVHLNATGGVQLAEGWMHGVSQVTQWV
jgi:lysophospholipase L1-like esterase